MSDRLAVSAALSVLMMAIYILFGTDVPRAPLGPNTGGAINAIDAELPSADTPAPEVPLLDRVIPLSR